MKKKRLLLVAVIVAGLVAAGVLLRGPSYSYVSISAPDGSKTEVQASGWGANVEVQQGDATARSSAW